MKLLEIVDDGPIRTIAINRPERRNALNYATLMEIREAIKDTKAKAKSGEAVRAVVITGRGGAFSSGADVKEWSSKKKDADEPGHDWVAVALQMMQDVFELPIPTVAMIDGAAAGAGLDLALCCDFRFASDRSKFVCAYTRIGFPPDAGGSWLLPRLIGIERAKLFVYTGDMWDGTKAHQNGMVTEVHKPEELEAATMAFARKLASGPSVAQGQAKGLLDRAQNRAFAEQLREEHRAGRICSETWDHKEALAAFAERREVKFQGK